MSENISQSSAKEESGDYGDQTKAKRKRRHPISIPAHIKVVSDGPIITYHCNPCGKMFKTKANIYYHAYCLNKDGVKPFKCPQCGRGFVSQSHYVYHILVHTGERPYPCLKCGKAFRQRNKLGRHQKTVHDGEKPYACEHCHRKFAYKQNLNAHARTHSGEQPFACTHCDKRFTAMTNLKKHATIHTGERPFKCEQCGKSFAVKWTLDVHLKTHSGKRPFACEQCSMAFSAKKDLQRHRLVHSKARPWKCFLCEIKCRRPDNLNRHIKNVHKECKERHEEAKILAKEAAANYLKEKLGVTTVNKDHPRLNAAVTKVAITSSRDSISHRPVLRQKCKRMRHHITTLHAELKKVEKRASARHRKGKGTTLKKIAPKQKSPNGHQGSSLSSEIAVTPDSNMNVGSLSTDQNGNSSSSASDANFRNEETLVDSSHYSNTMGENKGHTPMETATTATINHSSKTSSNNREDRRDTGGGYTAPLPSEETSANHPPLESENCHQGSSFSSSIAATPDCNMAVGSSSAAQTGTVSEANTRNDLSSSDLWAPVAINEAQNLVVMDISENTSEVGEEKLLYMCSKCLKTFDTMNHFMAHAPCQASQKDDKTPPLPAGDAIPILDIITEPGNEKNCSFSFEVGAAICIII